jgi:uncharacterized protein (DUF58 family)
MNNIQELLLPKYLHSVKGLELLAKKAVASFLPGLHQSRRTGPGMEFSNYRTYQAGDDLRMLDWKLYARSDRFYIREAEQEKNIHVQFLIDTSASMLHEDDGLQKIDYARFLVATIGWLALQQGDQLSLQSINEHQITRLGPKPGRKFFQRLLYQLLQLDCSWKFPNAANNFASTATKREKHLLLFFTDLYEHNDEIFQTLKNYQRPQQEIIIFHLMGQNELEMSFKGSVTLEDLETKQRIQLGSKEDRLKYKELLNERIDGLKDQFTAMQMDYLLVNMQESPGAILQYFLKKRIHSTN